MISEDDFNTLINKPQRNLEHIASSIGHVRNAIEKSSPPAASEDALDGAKDDSDGEGEGIQVLQPEPNPPEEAEVKRQIYREIPNAYVKIEELNSSPNSKGDPDVNPGTSVEES
ncbi:unnamed protein product [Haemonchus placei]|uniref:NET domain-containing protein n=1 Tax=Haemonchus placei TaxID=6290 RepID=A0A0N4WLU2_HAEPC|nr:unnamed protein product [Haemonchus placei]